MARTPLARLVQSALRQRRRVRRSGRAADVEAHAAELPERRDAPSIAIVGAGLAGLTAAYRLKQHGLPAHVYEASDRIGRPLLDAARPLRRRPDRRARRGADRHGSQRRARPRARALAAARRPHRRGAARDRDARLVRRPAVHVRRDDARHAPASRRSSRRITRRPARRPRGTTTPSAAGSSTSCRSRTGSRSTCPAASPRRSARCSRPRTRSSSAGPADEQSSLNIVYLLGSSKHEPFSIFGASDERFHVEGGNERLTDALEARLRPEHVRRGMELTAIRANGDRFDLAFSSGPARTYDRVVLALPFTLLRTLDYRGRRLRDRGR